MSRPTITVSTKEDFAEMEARLNELPERIVSNLENVHFTLNHYIIAEFRETFETRPTICIPNTTTKIVFEKDCVYIYAYQWTFTYPLKSGGGNHSADVVNFVFINPNEDKKKNG
jgi:hypothetical protein